MATNTKPGISSLQGLLRRRECLTVTNVATTHFCRLQGIPHVQGRHVLAFPDIETAHGFVKAQPTSFTRPQSEDRPEWVDAGIHPGLMPTLQANAPQHVAQLVW